jgi:hypothetical protein
MESVRELLLEAKWKDLPRGWTKRSRKEFGKTLTHKKSKGFFTACMKKISGVNDIDNPESFCAALKDRTTGRTTWRGKGKD